MTTDIKKIQSASSQIKEQFEHGKLIELTDHDFETYKIDGHTVVRSKSEDAFIDYVLMSDQYFYENWITQFALGEVGGRNYFDMATWSEFTDQFTKGVIVVHEETKQFLFLIPKFIEPQFSENGKEIVARLCRLAGNAKFQHNEEQARTINEFAKRLTYVAENDRAHTGLTGLIPNVIYEFYNINPDVIKAAIYIRDHYQTISPEDKNFDRLTAILKNHFSGELVSEGDKKFVLGLTNNEFDFNDGIDRNPKNEKIKPSGAATKEEPYDPFSD